MNSILIDFDRKVKSFKPVNGVTNGPGLHHGALDSSRYFRELDLPLTRLHDTEFLSRRPLVDYYRIFRHIERDENDPRSYDFASTDKLMAKLMTLGIDIIFRLGGSATLKKVNKYAIFPCSVEKLSTILYRIAEHYCGGWANGYHYTNVSFEIWNEPDHHMAYRGEESEFHRFYALTSEKIRKGLPGVKVGGCAFTNLCGIEGNLFGIHWLDFVEKNRCPVDFVSYHFYGSDPARFRELAREARRLLDSHGLADVPTVLDEWNFNINFTDRKDESYRKISRIDGACFTAGTLAELQKAPLDYATYYDMQSNYMMLCYNGIYGFNGLRLVNKKPYYAFLYFKRLKELGTETFITDMPGVFTLAASDGKVGRAMITNYTFEHPQPMDVALKVSAPYRRMRIRRTDRKKADQQIFYGDIPETLHLDGSAFYYLEFEQ